MLLASGRRDFRAAELAWSMGFARGLFWIQVERRGLVLDTSFVPAMTAPAQPRACVYLLLEGSFAIHGGEAFEAPCAFIVSDEQLEGEDGARSLTYRAGGDRFLAVQLRVDQVCLSPRPQPVPPRLALDEASWCAARRAGAEPSVATIEALLRELARQGVITQAALDAALTPTSKALALLWRGVRPMVEKLTLTPTVKEVSAATNVSNRSIDRHVSDFTATFGNLGTGWRLATRHLRIKLAVMLLSADEMTVTEVARATSYGSVDALARAFRDAGIPAPSVVRERLRSAK